MQISNFLRHHYRHFNAAALIDAADGYNKHLAEGGKMMITLAGAMSTAEMGIQLAELIRQDKVQIISCTGAIWRRISSTWWPTTFMSACPTTATSRPPTSRPC